ncbi:FG-GAP repeat protein [mine drainage metagenome]|uniref:FG-GAP repeat protein n=1 Tax=mine drainage metagenome TaxID=410659 RepID=A0A1J5RWS6_9ZZZZ
MYISLLGFIKISAQPIINSFTPASGAVGTTVTITGTGFNTLPTNNIVIFGATKATVTAASTTGLTVTVPTGASFGPITVLNTTTGLTACSRQFYTPTFTPNSGNITVTDLIARVDFATDTNPYAVAIGDIDGDGKPDLIVANFRTNSISVFRNTSVSGSITQNSFAAKVDFAAGANPCAIAFGDIDGDGKPDLVVANYNNATVSVFRNISRSGNITSTSLAAKVDFPTGTTPSSVAIGDVDADGKPDLVVVNYNDNTVSVLRNTSDIGSGSINSNSFASKVDFTTGLLPSSVAIGDIDGDGKPDLVVANGRSYTFSVFHNTGSSGNITSNSFAPKVDFATSLIPYSVAIGDIDGDGKLDIVVANESNNTVSVFRNTSSSGNISSGSFAGKVDFMTNDLPFSVALGDMNGDGKPDIVVANEDSATVSVLRNKSISGDIASNSFDAKVDFKTGDGPYSVAIGDIDGDGKPDLVIANYTSNSISVLHNTPTFPPISLSYITPNIYKKDSVIIPLYPTISGGVVTSYSVGPALPAGLSLDTRTGVISGTPTVLSGATNYTVTASNIAGSASAIINITVIDIAPVISYSTPNIFIRGKSINALAPVISGGAVISYSISPALPNGLSIDALTGVISGTPTVLSSATNYTVTATNSGGIGTAVLNIAVIKIPDPTITNSGSTAICDGNSVLLISSEATGNQWYRNAAIIVGATEQSYSAKVAGTYTVIVSNSYGDTTNPSNAITVTVNPIPVIKFSLPVVCLPDAQAQFYDSSTIADNSQLSYYWNFDDRYDPSPSTLPNPVHTYSGVGPFNVQLKVTSVNNCVATLTKTLSTIYPQPHADFSFLKDSICVNESVQFSNQSNDNTVTNWFWDLANGNTSSLQNPAKTFIDSGTFNISLYFYNQQGCISDKKIKPIVVSPYPVLNLNSTYYMIKGEGLKIDYYYYGTNLKFLWVPGTYLSSDTDPYPVTKTPNDIIYTLFLTGASGCSVSQSTVVKVEKLYVPNAITPNGDGINDTWEIAFLQNYPSCIVQIFNRYGQEVFHSIGYSKPWDGRLNGQPLPVATYYYIIKTNAAAKPLSGSVTIIR